MHRQPESLKNSFALSEKLTSFCEAISEDKLVDTMVHDGLMDSFNNYHMGVTAENIAKKFDISRLDKDEFAINEISSPVEESSINNLKILIAEDEDISEEYITIIVRKFGKEILSVKTGKEAVEACRNNPDIDLVLMDINMPDMNGYEATRQIRKSNKDVIIIAQTAYALSGDKEKAIKAGCDDYISKPINKSELLEKIENCLGKK